MTRLKYVISSGAFYEQDAEGVFHLVTNGYSGVPSYRNDPAMVDMTDRGPIPPGRYAVAQSNYSMKTGPMTFRLAMLDGQDYGRSGFAIHGDNRDHTASHGCIILNRVVRLGLQQAQHRGEKLELLVVPTE